LIRSAATTLCWIKQKTEAILRQLEEQAMVIDSHARIEEMVDLMRSEIAGRRAA